MPTDLMRFVDYWIGVPLCFLFDIFRFLTQWAPAGKQKNPPNKILLIKLSEMGAIILANSLIKQLQADYPNARIYFLTFKRNKPAVELLRLTDSDRIFTITENSLKFVWDTIRTIIQLRFERIDVVFDLELYSRFTSLLTYLIGAPKRIGFYRYYYEGLYRGNFLTHKIQYNPMIHTAKLFLSLAQVVRLDKKSTPEMEAPIHDSDLVLPQFASSREEIDGLQQKLEKLGAPKAAKLFLINPGDGILPQREWPLENFVELGRMILKEPASRILLIGTGSVAKKADEFMRHIGDERCLDLTNQTTMSELMALYHMADALIVNDCGLAHIASLTPIKTFVIFGPETPKLYAPLGGNISVLYSDFPCSPCVSTFNHRRSACADPRCLKTIAPAQVYQAVQRASEPS